MPKVESTRRIAATPAQVWPLLADAARWPEWMPGIQGSRVLGERREGVGRRQLLEVGYAGQRGEVELEVTAWEPERRMAWLHLAERIAGKQQNFAKDIRAEITLQPADGGTVVSFQSSWEPVGMLGRMLGKTLIQSRAGEMVEQAACNLERLALVATG